MASYNTPGATGINFNGVPQANAIGQSVGQSFAPQQNQLWPVQQQQQVQTQGPRMIVDWVDGEAGMQAYPLGLDTIAYLFDKSTAGRFYIKMTDRSGMPVPARKFNFTEEIDEPKQEDQPISREEFNSLFKMVSEIKEAL